VGGGKTIGETVIALLYPPDRSSRKQGGTPTTKTSFKRNEKTKGGQCSTSVISTLVKGGENWKTKS